MHHTRLMDASQETRSGTLSPRPEGRKAHGIFHAHRAACSPGKVFFPMAGASDGWAELVRNLKPVIDEKLIEAYRSWAMLGKLTSCDEQARRDLSSHAGAPSVAHPVSWTGRRLS